MAFEEIAVQEHSGTQFIKIPDDFKINDVKVYLKKVGNVLCIIPFHNPWQILFNSIDDFSEDFMDDRKQPSGKSGKLFD